MENLVMDDNVCIEWIDLPEGVHTCYLDNNVLVGLYGRSMDELRGKLLFGVRKGAILCPFTAVQIDEFVVPITDMTEKMQRLLLLSALSDDWYLEGLSSEHRVKKKQPFDVFDLIKNQPVGRIFQTLFPKLIPDGAMGHLREALGIDPNSLANKSIPQVISELDRALKAYPSASMSSSLSEMIDQTLDFMKKQDARLFQIGVNNKCVLLFSLLDSLGYRPERPREYLKGTTFPDAMHVSLASGCDYLVSEDVRLRKKASAVYHYLGLPVKVFTAKEFVAELDQIGC